MTEHRCLFVRGDHYVLARVCYDPAVNPTLYADANVLYGPFDPEVDEPFVIVHSQGHTKPDFADIEKEMANEKVVLPDLMRHAIFAMIEKPPTEGIRCWSQNGEVVDDPGEWGAEVYPY